MQIIQQQNMAQQKALPSPNQLAVAPAENANPVVQHPADNTAPVTHAIHQQQAESVILNQQVPPVENIQLHTLDPANSNILWMIHLFHMCQKLNDTTDEKENDQDVPNFDLMALISEVSDQDLVLASTQVEERQMDTAENSSRTTMMQEKINNTRPQYQTFTSCHFEHVGTLNIHTHKH